MVSRQIPAEFLLQQPTPFPSSTTDPTRLSRAVVGVGINRWPTTRALKRHLAHIRRLVAPKMAGAKGLEWGTYYFRTEYDYTPRVRPYETTRGGHQICKMIRKDFSAVLDTIRTVAEFNERFANIEVKTMDPCSPEWGQNWLPAFDGMMIYALLGSKNPPHYLEIGSGNSTKFARRAIEDLGLSTQIISLDPCPREEIDSICDRVVRKAIEDADIDEILGSLGENSVVFIDNSHRSFQNSDVTVCFTELTSCTSKRHNLRHTRHQFTI